MTRRGTEHLANELSAVIDRFRREYEMTYAEVVGALELVKFDILSETIEMEE